MPRIVKQRTDPDGRRMVDLTRDGVTTPHRVAHLVLEASSRPNRATRRAENWRPVVGYEGLYEVSDRGGARSLDRIDCRGNRIRGRVLKPQTNRAGYRRVVLYRDGVETKRWVHRLVLEAFVGPRPEGHETRHLNGDPSDNLLANLAWGTRIENAADQIAHGTQVRGQTHGLAKLTARAVWLLRVRGLEGRTQQAAADDLGVDRTTISLILTGKTWRHITPDTEFDLVDGEWRPIL